MKTKYLTRPFSQLVQCLTPTRTRDTATRGHANPSGEGHTLSNRASRGSPPQDTPPATGGSSPSSPLPPRVKLEKRPHYLLSCMPFIKSSASRKGTARSDPEPQASGIPARQQDPVESPSTAISWQEMVSGAPTSRSRPVNTWAALDAQARQQGLLPPPVNVWEQLKEMQAPLRQAIPEQAVPVLAPEVTLPVQQEPTADAHIDWTFPTPRSPPPPRNPMSRRTRRSSSHDSTASFDHSSGSSSPIDGSPRSQPNGDWRIRLDSTLPPSSSRTSRPPVKTLTWISRPSSPPQVETHRSEDQQATPEAVTRNGTQVANPLPNPDNRLTQGIPADLHTFVDIPLQPKEHHIIDIDPPGSSRELSRSFSASGSGRSVIDQLALVAHNQFVQPLQDVVRNLREEPPAVPPGELATRLNQRFDLYIQREVERPLDMPRMLELVKERERQLALPKPEQNWDKAIQLYKKAFKLNMAQVEKGWHTAGVVYPLGPMPSNVLTLLPSLNSLKFSSLKPVAGASLEMGLQVGLMIVMPAINAWIQKFTPNLTELKRVGGRPTMAASSAPEFGAVTEDIQKALGEVDTALTALQDGQAGPAEAAQAAKAEQQLVTALQAYERRVDVNNLNYTVQHWQNVVRTARQVVYFLAPVAGQYLASPATGNGRYITYAIQVAATLGTWIAQQFASPQDEKNKQEDTILVWLKHFDVRKASAVAGNVAVDDLTEDDLDVRKFRAQWQGPDQTRLSALNDILQSRIDGHLASAAQLAGLTPLDWGELQALESRRHESPAPLSQAECARLAEVRQRPHEQISRQDLLEWMDLEERARDPLSAAEDRQFSALQAKFKTSTMSAHTWGRLQELTGKSDAEPDSLTWPEHEELAQLRDRSASSLTVAEHARIETLRIRSKFSPDAKDTVTRGKLEDKAGLSEAERAVLTRASRAQGNEGLPASADDFRAMGVIHAKLRGKLDDKELAAHGEALSRLSSGLTPAEKAQYVELRNKGRFNALDAKAQEELRDLERQVNGLRLDKRLLNWDWSKLSEASQSTLDMVLSGTSDLQTTLLVTKARMNLRQEFTPEFAQRYGSSFQMIIGGSAMPFVVGAGFRLASALGKKAQFESIRIPAGLATLAIGIMGAWATGALINFKIAERRRLRMQSEKAPSTTQLLLSSIPRAMFALPAEIKQLRHSAKVAASGKQWLARQGEHLQLAIRHASQRTDTQQAPGGLAPATAAPEVAALRGPVVQQPTPGTASDLPRSGDWLRAMDDLLAATADIQRRARELMGRAPQGATGPHPSAVYPLPA